MVIGTLEGPSHKKGKQRLFPASFKAITVVSTFVYCHFSNFFRL